MSGVILQTVFAADPSLAFIFFIAFSLMAVLGVRFALYAYFNLRATEPPAQAVIWEYLLLVGSTAALYGGLGAIESATAVSDLPVLTTPYRDGVLLGFLLLLSLTMREIYDNDALGNAADDDGVPGGTRETVELAFALVVGGTVVGTGVFGDSLALTLFEGGGAVVFTAYGLYFGGRQLSRSSVRGTMIDSLLRHLLPVSTFALLVLVVDLAVLLGPSVAVARHIQVVFVIMTATALMTSTIKLRQNVAGF
jgi:hypothetical protein